MEIITHEKIHNIHGEQHPSIEEIHHPIDVILPLPRRVSQSVASEVSFSGGQTLQRIRTQVWHLTHVVSPKSSGLPELAPDPEHLEFFFNSNLL